MKTRLTTLCTLLLMMPAALSLARGKGQPFPGKGEGAIHSNAPSTGTQVKGKERAMEVGKGEKKGLHREEAARKQKVRGLERAHDAKKQGE